MCCVSREQTRTVCLTENVLAGIENRKKNKTNEKNLFNT